LYYNECLNIDEYIPKDGNATLNIENKLNEKLLTFLGFISKNDLLIRLDIFNEFEKQLFKRENRGPFSLPMDLSNLLGIKKDKLISILKSRSFNIQEIAENDLIISKKISNNNKTLVLKQNRNKKVLKKPSKNCMCMIESMSGVLLNDQSFRIDFKSNLRFSRTLSKKE